MSNLGFRTLGSTMHYLPSVSWMYPVVGRQGVTYQVLSEFLALSWVPCPCSPVPSVVKTFREESQLLLTVSEARYQGTIVTAAHAHWQKISLMKRFPYTLQCDFNCHDGVVKRIIGRNSLERRSGPSWIWGKSSHFAPWKCHPPL